MLKIVQYPHKALRQKAKPVKAITPDVKTFANKLLKTLVPHPKKPLGVGLAATQVGDLRRIFIVKLSSDKFEIVVNPRILKASKKTLSQLPEKHHFLEGCLSITSYWGFVDRPIKIRVSYKTINGLDKQTTLTPPHSSYFAHELDHLNGILFIDYVKKNSQQLYQSDDTGKMHPIDSPF